MKLRNTLVLSIIGLCLCVSIAFTASQYLTAKSSYDQNLREKLTIIAQLAAHSIDAELHQALRDKKDEQSATYRQIQQFLREVRSSDPEIAYIYTMRQNPADQSVYFVVDAAEDEKDMSHLGDVYDDVTEAQRKALQSNSGVTVEDTFYTDEWGSFLSAYAPIVGKDGVSDGVVGVDISIEHYQADLHRLLIQAAVLAAIITTVAAGIAYFLAQRITRPIRLLIPILKKVADADLSGKIPAELTGRKDEIGELGQSVATLQDNLRQIITELSKGANLLSPSAASLSAFADTLESNTDSLASQVLSVTAAAGQSTDTVTAIAANANEVSASMQTVAKAIAAMNLSVNDISRHCQQEARIVDAAGSSTTVTKELMVRLNSSSNHIGKIVDVINEIAAQTNLLALNATIEAARAGDSGKGFAVVANEIKLLARQTAESSQQIRDQVFEMQTNTAGAVDAIEKVTEIIEQITKSSQTIVTAVEEQGTVIGELASNMATSSQGASAIAQHVDNAAEGLLAISTNMNDINQISLTTANSVESIKQNSQDLANQAKIFKQIVTKFRVGDVV